MVQVGRLSFSAALQWGVMAGEPCDGRALAEKEAKQVLKNKEIMVRAKDPVGSWVIFAA